MNQYLPLKRRSFELGDEYYRCVGEKLRKKQAGSIDECLELGHQYRSALEKQLTDVTRFSDPNFVNRERDLITTYLRLIEDDLERLGQGEIDSILKGQRPQFDD